MSFRFLSLLLVTSALPILSQADIKLPAGVVAPITSEPPAATITPTPAPNPAPASAVPAQPAVPAAMSAEPPVEIRRAIAVEDTPPAVVPAPVVSRIVYTSCKVPAPVIAITFDDGPNPDHTPRLLDMLKARNIKATFFMVGRCVVTWPHIVKRIADEGHEVANHSWSHPLLTGLGNTSLDSQLQKTHDAILKACGKAPLHYRPPYGAIGMSQRKRINEKLGYSTILWDVDPLDWKTPRNSKKVEERILASTRSGSIILAHDIHGTTVDAMPATLDALIARGYQFATVSQLIELEKETSTTVAATAPASMPLLPEPTIPVVPMSTLPPETIAPAQPAKAVGLDN
ncbi:MAG: polysaccharide deacetylase family protein [Verrucomicrobia bacterium]|nr:polysaccharide deacetylase family protein [Verrucomicrobiota bacterium]